LTSLLANGLIPDPHFGVGNESISDVFDAGDDALVGMFRRHPFDITDAITPQVRAGSLCSSTHRPRPVIWLIAPIARVMGTSSA
jgi:hypothetical protein